MDSVVFKVALPAALAAFVVGLALLRLSVRRRINRDPIRLGAAHPHEVAGFAEGLLSAGTVGIALDVVLNALWADEMAMHYAIPAIRNSATAGWTGLFVLATGLLLDLWAVRSMGDSWRVGLDRESPGALITTGLYRYVRHPIYAAILMVGFGMALISADIVAIDAAAMLWAAVSVQARLEEAFMAATYPQYNEYRMKTGRFFPPLLPLEPARNQS